MIKIDQASIKKLLPKVCDWLEQQENAIISQGRLLTSDEQSIAREIGVKNYDIVRVWMSKDLPFPNDALLLQLAKQIGLLNSNTQGICFRYGIFIHEQAINPKEVLAHELIHTLQYERFGSIEAFITQYLSECIEDGYHQSNLEKEANLRLCKLNL